MNTIGQWARDVPRIVVDLIVHFAWWLIAVGVVLIILAVSAGFLIHALAG